MKKATRAQMAQAIGKADGNVSAAAAALGIARSTLNLHIARSPALQDAVQTAREALLDEAETVLARKVREGYTPELLFFLKTQGRSRGYIERQEHDISITDKRPEVMSDSELEEFIADLKAHVR